MTPRLLSVLAAGALSLSLLGPVTAGAEEPADDARPAPGLPALPPTAAERASAALDDAQSLFEERSPAEADEQRADTGLDATLALNQLVRARDALSPAERRQADRLLARPTDPGGDRVNGATYAYEDGEEDPVCGDTICVHYAVPSDTDAPPATDVAPANGVPDAVDDSLAVAEDVNETYVAAGYRRPDPDGTLGGDAGKVDVYLADTGESGVYGYCTVDEEPDAGHGPAYCVIDDDFAEFRAYNPPADSRRVTLAHEYFHAIQFAYDYFEDVWVLEATATWAEDELYDDVDDNLQYLPSSQVVRPDLPLDLADGNASFYGQWIFFRYLTERWDERTGSMPTLVLDLWERMSARPGAPDDFSTRAVQQVLDARGTAFSTVYGQFADANRRPARAYDEGASYPTGKPERNWLMTRDRRTRSGTATLDHLTSLTLRFRPAGGLTQRDWELRLGVDMPSARTAPVARVATYFRNGDVRSRQVRLDGSTEGRRTVGFSRGDVRYVELVLGNASRRMTSCGRASDRYACSGRPRDDDRQTRFTAKIARG